MITPDEQAHIDRVWAELERGAGEPGAQLQPTERRWYIAAGDVPKRPQAVLFRGPARGTAKFHAVSVNRKLAPVALVDFPGQPRPRPIAQGPFVSSTYTSIAATCPDSCAFKRSGCFASEGFTKIAVQKLDAAASGRGSLEVVREEAELIRRSFRGAGVPQDGARGGRDLRLHVGGDVGDERGARELGRAAAGWRARGGGSVWTYTHHWAAIARSAWGPAVSVLASVESVEAFDRAADQGYAPAIVVERFRQRRAWSVLTPRGEVWRVIPCPAETGKTTCASCRLCLDRDLLKQRAAIAFAVHGTGTKAATEKLVQLRRGQ